MKSVKEEIYERNWDSVLTKVERTIDLSVYSQIANRFFSWTGMEPIRSAGILILEGAHKQS